MAFPEEASFIRRRRERGVLSVGQRAVLVGVGVEEHEPSHDVDQAHREGQADPVVGQVELADRLLGKPTGENGGVHDAVQKARMVRELVPHFVGALQDHNRGHLDEPQKAHGLLHAFDLVAEAVVRGICPSEDVDGRGRALLDDLDQSVRVGLTRRD
jgi:hypothetical protein